MITISLDTTLPLPLYEQIYQHIRSEIAAGRLPAGSRLPSRRQLAAHLHCSMNTVQTAYAQLSAEGYLDARDRSGYYVQAIEHQLALPKSDYLFRDAEINETENLIDFSYQGVDPRQFPFTIWRRIVRQTGSQHETDFLKSGDPQGDIKLRQTIAAYLRQSRGVRCHPDQIIVSSGTEQLLLMLIQLFDKDKIYAIESPGYEKLVQIFRSSRSACRILPLDDSGLIPAALAASGADIVCITPSHQFPTGVIMPVSRRASLLKWANSAPGRFIIEDDYDSEFRFEGRPIPSLQSMDESGRVIYLGSFSKSLTPALRISYMILSGELLAAYREQLGFYICPVPVLEQKILDRFIRDGHFERHLNRMRSLYKEKREILTRALAESLPGARISGANAGLHLVIHLPNADEQELVKAARQNSVIVYGLSKFYAAAPPSAKDAVLLLGFATLSPDELVDGVNKLARAAMRVLH